ncbi:MAG TPA: DNA polymerase I [Steroidobacteraceae bacterium]|nr:DNA polymerase I [Steroidobacteraceae bacterium]HRX90479.1 DNA polymerase I [Steroidobacteraceae bacterium]
MNKPDLVLIDGSSYLYRAFHALPPFTTSRGEPTGAVFGVLNMLTKFLKDYPVERIAVVFDAPGKTFRDELFAEYKAQRPPMPDDLRAQIEPLLEAVRGLGLPMIRLAGVEADDVIGTLACAAAKRGQRVLISTGDKDMAQLVDPHVTLINTMSNTVLDRDGVKQKFDVWPEQIIDYLALVGDSSDNIPGIDKVGPKTAAKWLGQYRSLDAIVANAAEIPGKVGENLRAGLDTLALARKLATIHTDVELPIALDDLARKAVDTEALRALYTRLELRSLLKQLDGGSDTSATPAARSAGNPAPAAAPKRPAAQRQYDMITTSAALDAWLQRLRQCELFAFDTETTSLDYMQAEIVGVSFCIEPGKAAYVPLRHDYAGVPEQLERDAVLGQLKPLLEASSPGKVGHHLKYDAHVLANHGIALGGMRYDSMLESYVWNSVATRHDMDSVALTYLGINTIHYEDVAGKGAKQIPFSQVPLETAAEYAAEDADVTLQLHQALWPQLESIPALRDLYEQIEQPLVPVLLGMEATGVLIDREMLKVQSGELTKRLQELQGEAHAAAGQEFNLDSPKQLQQILFEKLQLPVMRKTPKGQPSTAEDVLEELAASYPLPRLILEYRGLAKLKSTYTDKLPEQINARTGRVHTSYHQAVAQTGRLSSTDPNLQNIPIRTAEGRRIRQAFLAPPDYVLMAADYSQIELRIMAHLSEDEGLLKAFASDQDIHQATAAEVFGVEISEVSSEQRRSAKAINFGLIYGMSAFGLARQLGIDRGSAANYVDLYFARYPGVKRYMDETRARAKDAGYVETVFGRRLYLPDIGARNRQLQQYAERSAINAPMQGTAADIIKKAMLSVDAWCRQDLTRARLIMQVHDELVLEVHQDQVAPVRDAIRQHMVDAAELRVPLKVDIGTGKNWDEAH